MIDTSLNHKYIYIYVYIYGESIDIGSNMLTSYYHMQKQAFFGGGSNQHTATSGWKICCLLRSRFICDDAAGSSIFISI